MSAVRTRDTGPEVKVRAIVHGLGFRYSLRRTDLPGKPDLVFVSRRKVIFVHGCFWHGHSCKHGKLPKSRLSYWRPKVAANRVRDRLRTSQLRRNGWGVLTIWQCQLKNALALQRRIAEFLSD
jgi:DNA mismatch endonuclease (patch repair protein)